MAKGRGQKAERMHIDWLRFQYLARVLIALATAIAIYDFLATAIAVLIPNPGLLPSFWATHKSRDVPPVCVSAARR
jgi:hypothetical protein